MGGLNSGQSILNVIQPWIAYSLPMTMIPFLTANLSYHSFVSLLLSTGDLNCQTCTKTWSTLVGFVLGGLCPLLLAIPLNGGLAARYEWSPLPQRGNIFSYWITASKPVFKKCYSLLYFCLCLQHIMKIDNTTSS